MDVIDDYFLGELDLFILKDPKLTLPILDLTKYCWFSGLSVSGWEVYFVARFVVWCKNTHKSLILEFFGF